MLKREVLLYKKLTEKGVKITFITYGDSKDYKWKKHISDIELIPIYDYIKRPKNRIMCLIQSFFLPWIIKDNLKHVDIFKTNQIRGGWVAVIAKWLLNKPLLSRCGHDYYWFAKNHKKKKLKLGIIKFLSYLTYFNSNRIHVATKEDSIFIQREFNLSNYNVYIQPNWIDTEKFCARNNTHQKNNTVLYVGRLTSQKNIPMLIQAINETNYSLDIIGTGEDELALKTASSKFSDKIHFLGAISNELLTKYYQQYPVYVICSNYEGNPKTLLEAMSCESGVIGTDVPGINSVIKHKKNGLLCLNSKNSLQSAIVHLMTNQKLREKLGKQARLDIHLNNSLKKYIQWEINSYKKILKII
jgi:glycosyltransferase involved in cell wall biosynthesis